MDDKLYIHVPRDCHVWNGTHNKNGRFSGRIFQTERNTHRMSGTVYGHAVPGVDPCSCVEITGRSGVGSDSGGMLSGRDCE